MDERACLCWNTIEANMENFTVWSGEFKQEK